MSTGRTLPRALGFSMMVSVSVSLAAAAEVIPVGPAEVIEATVYLEGAEITSEVSVRVPVGSSIVEVGEFPRGVDSDAVRVSANTSGVDIGAFTVLERKQADLAGREAISSRMEELDERLRELEQEVADQKVLREFLVSSANRTVTPADADASDAASSESIAAVYALLEGKLESLKQSGSRSRSERAELLQERAEAKAELDGIERAGTERVAQIEVSSSRAQTVTIEYSYFAAAAAWVPSYRAVLGDDGTLELVAHGLVRQRTGQDWSNTQIKLATVQPSGSLAAPYLGEWLLTTHAAPDSNSGDAWSQLRSAPGVLVDRVNVGGNENGQQASFRAPASASGGSRFQVVTTRFSAVFDIAERASVSGGGEETQVELWREALPARVTYRIKPSLREVAFRETIFTAPEQVPLLPGRISLYDQSTLLGHHQLSDTAPSSEVILPLGVDRRLEVDRRVLDTLRKRPGRQLQVRELYETTIVNQHSTPVEIAVEERLPVTEDERVTVTLASETTGGSQESETRRGVRIWKLRLDAGESSALRFGYSIRWPKEVAVAGM